MTIWRTIYILILFVVLLAIGTYLNLTKPVKTALEPRGPQVETNIIDYESWSPDVKQATTTLPKATNLVPPKFIQPKQCYQFADKKPICQ